MLAAPFVKVDHATALEIFVRAASAFLIAFTVLLAADSFWSYRQEWADGHTAHRGPILFQRSTQL